MTGPRNLDTHPQHRRGRRLLPFLIILAGLPVGCSSDQPTESTLTEPAAATARLHPYLTVEPSTGGQLRAATAVSGDLAVGALGPANGPKVLILADVDGVSTQTLASSLFRAGYQVTVRAPENTWTGNDPALTGFGAVIHIDGTSWNAAMSPAAQIALTDFVQNGGGFIGGTWLNYEQSVGTQKAMTNLVLQGYSNTGREQDCSRCAVTYTTVSEQSRHPLLAGIPASFSFSADGHHAGAMIPFLSDPSTMLMRVGSGNPGVLVRQFGQGKVVDFSFAPNYSWGGAGRTLLDANVQRLYLNAVRWTAGSPPDGDSDGVPDFADNCPAVPNPNQADANANGMGDACEVDQPQVISFAELGGKTFGDPDFNVSASSSSGLPVSFGASGKCTISGVTVHLTGGGTCTITAQQGGNLTYRPAEPVARSFSIAKATATLALSDLTQTYSGSPKAAGVVTSPAGLGTVSLTYNGGAAAPVKAGSYAVTASLDNEDYQAAPVSGTLVIRKAPATITVGTEFTYDGTPKAARITTSPEGLIVVTVTYTRNGMVVTSPTNAGVYDVLAHLENENYEAIDARGTLTILPATPTINWEAPRPIIVGTRLGSEQLNAFTTGVGGASVAGALRYTPSAGMLLPVGTQSLSVQFTSSDANYTNASKSVQVSVIYAFSGFLKPVKNAPALNHVRAGRAIPIRFSLGRVEGMKVLRAGSPTSSGIGCPARLPATTMEDDEYEDDSHRGGLRADGAKYTYVWKTDRRWAGTCRKLVLTLDDGTTHEALFRFKSKHGDERAGKPQQQPSRGRGGKSKD